MSNDPEALRILLKILLLLNLGYIYLCNDHSLQEIELVSIKTTISIGLILLSTLGLVGMKFYDLKKKGILNVISPRL